MLSAVLISRNIIRGVKQKDEGEKEEFGCLCFVIPKDEKNFCVNIWFHHISEVTFHRQRFYRSFFRVDEKKYQLRTGIDIIVLLPPPPSNFSGI